MNLVMNELFTLDGFDYQYELVVGGHSYDRSKERGVKWGAVKKAIQRAFELLMDDADAEGSEDSIIRDSVNKVTLCLMKPVWTAAGALRIVIRTVLDGGRRFAKNGILHDI